MNFVYYSGNSVPKEPALNLVLVEAIARLDGKSHKRNMEEADFGFKNCKKPRLQPFDTKIQKLGYEHASSVVSFSGSKSLLKILEEPLSTKAENHNQSEIERRKRKRHWGEIVVFPPPFKKRCMILMLSTFTI